MKSSKKAQEKRSTKINDEQVVQFLEANPKFFERHQDLLSQLKISHPTGDAVSLVERQVSLLRDKISRQDQEQDILLKAAEQNWQFLLRLHALVKDLVEETSLAGVFETVSNRMKKDFDADEVLMELSTVKDEIQTFGGVSGLTELFGAVVEKKVPISGPLKDDYRQIFKRKDSPIKSGVLIPINSANWSGILVIGSSNLDRYKGTPGTEFLCHLRDLMTLIINPFYRDRA